MSKPNIKLNTEQRKLVEDNHDLIYGFMLKHNLDFENWYDVCAIGLCKAVVAYDGSTKLSTFAYTAMLNAVRRELKLNKCAKRDSSGTISLDTTTVRTSANEEIPILESINSGVKNEDKVVNREWVRWFLEYASSAMLKVVYVKLTQCKTCQEVSEKLNVSREAVNKQMRILQKHIKDDTRPYCRLRYDDKEERDYWREKVYKTLDKICWV